MFPFPVFNCNIYIWANRNAAGETGNSHWNASDWIFTCQSWWGTARLLWVQLHSSAECSSCSSSAQAGTVEKAPPGCWSPSVPEESLGIRPDIWIRWDWRLPVSAHTPEGGGRGSVRVCARATRRVSWRDGTEAEADAPESSGRCRSPHSTGACWRRRGVGSAGCLLCRRRCRCSPSLSRPRRERWSSCLRPGHFLRTTGRGGRRTPSGPPEEVTGEETCLGSNQVQITFFSDSKLKSSFLKSSYFFQFKWKVYFLKCTTLYHHKRELLLNNNWWLFFLVLSK